MKEEHIFSVPGKDRHPKKEDSAEGKGVSAS